MAESQSTALPPLEERPLVTFALFAYNQEKYIREAVEGAFAQTYEPLEIILSDDCSTDRTFEIMEEMAAGYRGPHRVRVRRSPENVGTLKHVLNVAEEASGTFMVVGAGDDISRPERTDKTVTYLLKSGSVIVSAACDEFTESPSTITRRREPVRTISDYLVDGRPIVQQIHGATAAYQTKFLRNIPYPKEKVLLEDYALQIIAFWKKCRVDSIDESVVLHRIHDENIGPKKKNKKDRTLIDHERVLCSHFERLKVTIDYLSTSQSLILPSRDDEHELFNGISSTARQYVSLRAKWMTHSLDERIRFFKLSRSFDSPRRDALRSLGTFLYFKIISLL